MHTRNRPVLFLVSVTFAIGSVGAGWLLAGQRTSGQIEAPASAPGTLPAADHLPPPWQAAPPAVPADAEPILRGLHEIARAVTCMVDGETVKNVITERSQEKIFQVDPRDKWAAGDNWDYNHEPFIKVKQTLQRAAYLAPGHVTCNLYMPAMANPKKWCLVMNTVYGGKQMMTSAPSNAVAADPDRELVQVFMTGRRLEVSRQPGQYSVLTPVYDSEGEIVAVVEVFTREAGYKQVRK